MPEFQVNFSTCIHAHFLRLFLMDIERFVFFNEVAKYEKDKVLLLGMDPKPVTY